MILTIAFLSSVLMCANAFAAATGRCGNSIKWTLDDSGNLTLSGSGEMWNYDYRNPPFEGCEIKTVTIGDGITSIGDYVFKGCSGMTELTLPNSITSIGESAFEDCSGLTELTLPNGVTSIGNAAFEDCSGLIELTLPNSVTSIGDFAFWGCTGLTELILPNSVTSIGDLAFWGCTGLTELILPNSVRSIGYGAFSGCSGLEKITVGRGNKRYDSWGNCNSIIETETNTLIVGCKNSVIPNSVTSIGDGAFWGCTGLTELILPNGVTSIGKSAFRGCTGLTELILPNSVRSIGDFAFLYCSGLEKITVESGNSCYDSRDNCNSIIDTETNTLIVGCKNSVIPNSVTSIGYAAFGGCSGLTELTLPNSVMSIGCDAFYDCSGMTELTLPNSVTSIVDYAFSECSGLAKITSLAEIPPMCGFKVFDGVNKTNCELIVPGGSVAAYTQAEVWNEFSNISGFSGVEDTVADGNTIRAIGNQIEISGDFTSVEVYGINGALIYKGKDNVVTVPSAGIYLVHVAGKTRKIVVE